MPILKWTCEPHDGSRQMRSTALLSSETMDCWWRCFHRKYCHCDNIVLVTEQCCVHRKYFNCDIILWICPVVTDICQGTSSLEIRNGSFSKSVTPWTRLQTRFYMFSQEKHCRYDFTWLDTGCSVISTQYHTTRTFDGVYVGDDSRHFHNNFG